MKKIIRNSCTASPPRSSGGSQGLEDSKVSFALAAPKLAVGSPF